MEPGQLTTQHLTFQISGEEYAIPILRVREIVEYVSPTRVPSAPACFRGVINLRGSVVPVVDLAVKFDLPRVLPTRRTCVVIVEVDGHETPVTLGVIADSVSDVIDLSNEDIEPAPQFGTRIRVEFLRGIGKSMDKLVLVLEIDRVLAPGELSAAAEAAEQTPPGDRNLTTSETAR